MRTEKQRQDDAFLLVQEELRVALLKHGRFHSAHEGIAVIMEEVDELKAEVWKRREERDPGLLIKEARQIAAMAVRFIVEIGMPLAEESHPETCFIPNETSSIPAFEQAIRRAQGVIAEQDRKLSRAKNIIRLRDAEIRELGIVIDNVRAELRDANRKADRLHSRVQTAFNVLKVDGPNTREVAQLLYSALYPGGVSYK